MIPGIELIDFIQWGGLIAVALIVFAESGLLIGFFLPGDSLLFTTGFLIHADILQINLYLAIAIIFVAAVVGDNVGYTFGRKAGPRVFSKPDARLFKQEFVQEAQKFYEKHGGKTIILARFVPIVRTFAPIIAGTAKMEYKKFVTYNIIGGLVWAAGITYLGYVFGGLFEKLGIEIDHLLLPIILVIVFVSVLPPAIHLLRNKSQRIALWNGTKREIQSLFSSKK